MPFPIVWGIPSDVSDADLNQLRLVIVDVLATHMEAPKSWVRPFFPVCRLGEPTEDDEGGKTIFIELNTAMFHRKPESDSKARSVAELLVKFVWKFFDGKYEVECMVADFNPNWMHIIKASEL